MVLFILPYAQLRYMDAIQTRRQSDVMRMLSNDIEGINGGSTYLQT